MSDSNRDRLQLAAAWSRIVLGLLSIVFLPMLYPGFEQHRWVFGVYVIAALGVQALIYKGIGGQVRSLIDGIVDMAMITFIVHRVGSMGTMMHSAYFFAVLVNTLVVGRRVGVTLAVVGSGFYAATLACEQHGWLPYGANAPFWATTMPSHTDAFVAASLHIMLLIGSAGLVGVLVTRIAEREKELRALAERLEELSLRDPLTGLFNRRHLMQRLEVELARVRRGNPLAVLMIDLDRFKRINDKRGHHRGDDMLEAIAKALAEATREVDVPGRYGGDEFVVVLPDTTPAAAIQVGERLVVGIREAGQRLDAELPVTASVGLAFALEDDGARPLIQRADRYAYAAKEAGGDQLASEPRLPDWDEEDDSRVRPASHTGR